MPSYKGREVPLSRSLGPAVVRRVRVSRKIANIDYIERASINRVTQSL